MAKRQLDDIRQWAVLGAEQRLVQLAEEARAIFQHFPELRAEGRGFQSTLAPSAATEGQQAGGPKVRRRPKLSAEARKRISEAVKARWARQKAGKTAGASNATGRDAKAGKVAHTKSRRSGPRRMSAEARRRISEAQKARWAKLKVKEKPAGASQPTAQSRKKK